MLFQQDACCGLVSPQLKSKNAAQKGYCEPWRGAVDLSVLQSQDW